MRGRQMPRAKVAGRRRRVVRRPQTEPAMIRGVVVSVLGLFATLGVGWAADVDRDTVAAVSVALAAILPLLQGLWTRFAVTPAAEVVAQVTPAGEVVAGPASTTPTGQLLHVSHGVRPGQPPVVQFVGVDSRLVS